MDYDEVTPLLPDWSDIPEDDSAEPDDADIDHTGDVEDLALATDPQFVADREEALREYEAGETTSLDDFLSEEEEG